VIRFLHSNDFHGTLGGAKLAAMQDLRRDADVYVDTGDIIRAGNLGIPLRPEVAWEHLADLDCTVSCLGNRETHVFEAAFRAKTAGVRHPLLCGNMFTRSGNLVLPASRIVQFGGQKVGFFSVMVPMVTEKMRTQAASAYLWSQPIAEAQRIAAKLRPQVHLLVALTHIGYRQDQLLAETCPGIDIIFGGHSHTVLESPVLVNKTWIAQGGSHGRFAGVYQWVNGTLTGGLVPLPAK